MWKRRVGAIVLMVLFIFPGAIVEAVEPPSHRLFSTSEQDLLSIVSYLSNIQTLCEDAMRYCVLANATIDFNNPMKIVYNTSCFDSSIQIQQQLEKTLISTIHETSDLYEHAESYAHIKNVITPLHQLVENISMLVNNHSMLISIFDELIDLSSNQSSDRDEIIENVHFGYLIIANCKQELLEIDTIISYLSSYFSTSTLNTYTDLLNKLAYRYQTYLEEFLSMTSSLEPELFLFIDTDHYYVGEAISIMGLFISNNSDGKKQNISIYLDKILMSESVTNDNGSFQTNITIPLHLEPREYTVHGETIYHNALVRSTPVNISILPIPTILSLHLSQTEYRPDEDIILTGRLSTNKNQGITEDITIQFGQQTYTVWTNETGYFQNSIHGITTCGIYTIQGIFEPESIYDSCTSEINNVWINYPTYLSISVDRLNASVGDTIIVSGQLSNSSSNRPLSNKTVTLTSNDKTVSYTKTNETGEYQFIWDTSNESDGMHELTTVYASDDITLRDTHSNSIHIQLSTSLVASLVNLFLFLSQQFLIPFSLIVALLFMFYFLRRTTKHQRQNMTDVNTINNEKQIIQTSNRSFDDILKERYNKAASLNKKIIYQYHLFIHHLIKKNIPILKSNTHLEIQDILHKEGYPTDSVSSVTITFEQAQYAPYIADEQDLIIFNDRISNMLEYGGKNT